MTPMHDAGALPRRCRAALLRRLSVDDLAAFQAVRGDPELARYQGWSAQGDDAARAFLAGMATLPFPARGDWLQLAIADADSGALLGDIGLFVAADGDEAELGFTLARAAQGRGIATAAVEAALGLLWAHTPVRRVLGITDARNTPSIRLLERLGFRRIETRDAEFKGERCTEFVYAIARP
jgi:RimJ/RimL family protein N-acetyltransferase